VRGVSSTTAGMGVDARGHQASNAGLFAALGTEVLTGPESSFKSGRDGSAARAKTRQEL
jgi:hypothetical protein